MNKRRNLVINTIVIIFILVMVVSAVLIFTLPEKPVIEEKPKLALYGLQYSPTTWTVTAVVGFAGEDLPIVECDSIEKSYWVTKGFWFSEAYTKYTFDTQSLVSSVNALITNEDLKASDGTMYPREKIEYEFRYNTRFRSIMGGQFTESDVGYLHSFVINKNDTSSDIVLYHRYPETANWYSILAVIGIIIVGIATIISCMVLKRNDYDE